MDLTELMLHIVVVPLVTMKILTVLVKIVTTLVLLVSIITFVIIVKMLTEDSDNNVLVLLVSSMPVLLIATLVPSNVPHVKKMLITTTTSV